MLHIRGNNQLIFFFFHVLVPCKKTVLAGFDDPSRGGIYPLVEFVVSMDGEERKRVCRLVV